jgi:hypothetical protein
LAYLYKKILILDYFICFKVEESFKIVVEKLVRKSDDFEIDEEETLMELLENSEELWLVAISSNKENVDKLGKFF